MVVFGEAETTQWMALNPPAIDAIISRDTSKKGRRKNGGSVAEARRRTHQCIETEGSLPCCSCIWQGHHESTPCSGTYGQLHGGITSEGEGAFTNSGVRDMELVHLSDNMDYSEICSRSDKHRSRLRIEELQRSSGMDSQQDGIMENNQEVVYARSGPICLSTQQPVTTLCGEILRPGSIATDAFL